MAVVEAKNGWLGEMRGGCVVLFFNFSFLILNFAYSPSSSLRQIQTLMPILPATVLASTKP